MIFYQNKLHLREFFLSLRLWLSPVLLSVTFAQNPAPSQPASVTAPVGIPLEAPPAIDSLQLTLVQAEELFKKHNINLLTAQLGISESQAQQIQAQLRPNPTIYAEIMPYNNGTAYASGATDAGRQRFLPLGSNNSEQVLQVQQLLLLAGKRDKQLALARTNTEIARDRFFDVVRTLTYQLRSTFYTLYYNQQSVAVYDQEMEALRQTVTLFQQQYDKGNVPLKDLARLKAYLFNLTSERQQLLLQLTNAQADMAVLLNINPATLVRPLVSTSDTANYHPASLSINDLYTLAEQNRFDLKAYTDQANLEQQNLALQKAIAVPDLTVQGSYDRNGSFGQNYLGVGVGIPIPVANKNQGNIQAAKIRIQSSQQVVLAYNLQVRSEVQRAYAKTLQIDQLYRTFDNQFNEAFARLIQGVTESYRKQNLSVIEFLDFLDSYKNSQIQYRQLQNNRMQSLEELQFAVGKNPFVR
jgi:cobalt-zinc-cadmium efflux system outer membrane protein